MLIPQQKLTPTVLDILEGIFTDSDDLRVLRRYIPKKNIFWAGSGRAGLQHILLSIKSKNVGLPSFTCQVVLDAVKRANANAVLIDSGIIANYKNIENIIGKIDTLILPYNFGFLPEIEKIAKLCKKKKVTLIEDCAQALGATFDGKLAGSFGDYAFYSFGISKNIGFLGGLIATDKLIQKPKLPMYPVSKIAKAVIETIAAPLFFYKHYYPIVFKPLQKELLLEQSALNYSMPKLAKKIILNEFRRYDRILMQRTQNAMICIKELDGIVDFVNPVEKSCPSWLYFVFFAKDRDRIKKELLKHNVDIQEFRTYTDLSKDGVLAKDAEMRHMAFALYRPEEEVKYMINKIKKVCR